MIKVEEGKSYVGTVEDNNDPKKIGRVRVRVLNVFDDLEVDDIPWARPWKDLGGNSFNIPDKGKIVTVVFENANIYKPEYLCSDHFNVNLEKKLSQLSEADYLTMKALIFDHKTQIYVNEGEGLKLDHKFNMINIKDKSINVNLKDNFGKINLGTANSTQRAILGDNFLNWFDDFVKILLGDQGGPFLGNLGAPVIATPALMSNLQIYQQKKIPKFLSKNVYIVDNEDVAKLDRIAEGQKGDTWKSTVKENELTKNEPVNYKATPGSSATQFDKPAENAATQSTAEQPEAQSPVDALGPKQPVNPADINNGAPPKPEQHPDVDVLLQLMNDKQYTVYTQPYKLNIVAIRNQCLKVGDQYTDDFVDELYVMYKDDSDNWELRKYKISTVPGVEFVITDSWIKDRKALKNVDFWNSVKGQKSTTKDYYKIETVDGFAPNGEEGLVILAPSQYIDVFLLSTYRGEQALLTHGDSLQSVYIDKDYSLPFTFKPSNFTRPQSLNLQGKGDFRIGLHKGYPGGKKVGDWSEGSHCFQDANALSDFFELCNKHVERHKDPATNSCFFTYTLALKGDWDQALRDNEIDKQDQSSPQPTPVSATTPATEQSATNQEPAKTEVVPNGVRITTTGEWKVVFAEIDSNDTTAGVVSIVSDAVTRTSDFIVENSRIKEETLRVMNGDEKDLAGYPNVVYTYIFTVSNNTGQDKTYSITNTISF